MISKNKISELKKLSQKKFRAESGLFIVEGTKSVEDMLASSLPVEELFATTSWLQAHHGQLAGITAVEVTDTEPGRELRAALQTASVHVNLCGTER